MPPPAPPEPTLSWRAAPALAVPVALALGAGLAAGAALLTWRTGHLGAVPPLPLALSSGGLGFLVIAVTLMLCRRHELTTPALYATALSVAHACLAVGGVAILLTPSAVAEVERFAAGDAGALQALSGSPDAMMWACYGAAFVALTLVMLLSVTAIRALCMTDRAAAR